MEHLKTLAEISGAFATVGALALAIWQLRENARRIDENFARQMWIEYLRCGLANPELGEDWLAAKLVKPATVENLVKGETLASQRYLWFLTLVLDTCEGILTYMPTPHWRKTVDENLRFHADALRFLWPREKPQYSAVLGRAVERALVVDRFEPDESA